MFRNFCTFSLKEKLCTYKIPLEINNIALDIKNDLHIDFFFPSKRTLILNLSKYFIPFLIRRGVGPLNGSF